MVAVAKQLVLAVFLLAPAMAAPLSRLMTAHDLEARVDHGLGVEHRESNILDGVLKRPVLTKRIRSRRLIPKSTVHHASFQMSAHFQALRLEEHLPPAKRQWILIPPNKHD